MPLNQSLLFTRVGSEIDYGLAYAFGVLANLAYFPEQNYDNAWGAAFGFTDTETIVTPGPELPNYTRIRGDGGCVFAIAGTESYVQMLDNIIYTGQVADLNFGDGYVHSFFRWCANGLIPFIDADLAGRPRSTKLAFTGHSLGGAVAHLLSWYYALQGWDVRNCVVFNSPKVGNKAFAQLSRPFGYWHVVNAYDKVSGLPPVATIEITNGFPLYGLVGNAWWHPDPMFQIVVAESFDVFDPNTPATRIAGWSPFLNRLSEHLHNANFETGAERALRIARERSRRTASYWIAAFTALAALNINNHKLHRLLAELLNLYRGTSGVLNLNDVVSLQEYLDTQPFELQSSTPYPRDFALVDPVPFLSPTPPANPSVPTTPTPPGTVAETTVVNGSALLLPRQTADVPTLRLIDEVIPPGAPIPEFFSDPRPHWLFRGGDRRLLKKLAKLLDMVEARDDLALSPTPTSKISTRETVIDWDDEDLVDNWYAVRSQLAYLLSLAHDSSLAS